MQAAVQADSKESPLRVRRRRPGRFSRAQFGGKCWISRSWSVRKRITFLPPSPLPPAPPGFVAAIALSASPSDGESTAAAAAPAPAPSSCLRVRPPWRRCSSVILILLKTSTALLSCEVE